MEDAVKEDVVVEAERDEEDEVGKGDKEVFPRWVRAYWNDEEEVEREEEEDEDEECEEEEEDEDDEEEIGDDDGE